MGLGPYFGIIYGAGMQFLRKLFLFYLALLVLRMFLLWNMEFLGGSTQWKVSFSREALDWEVDVFTSFFQVLHSVIVKIGSG